MLNPEFLFNRTQHWAKRTLDTLIIPGGRGARIGQSSNLIAKWISSRAKRIRRIASVCTGVYALAPTGLLDGRSVTTHWRFANDVARRFPKLNVDHDALFLKDGPFYTAGGITASVDLVSRLSKKTTDRASRSRSRASWSCF